MTSSSGTSTSSVVCSSPSRACSAVMSRAWSGASVASSGASRTTITEPAPSACAAHASPNGVRGSGRSRRSAGAESGGVMVRRGRSRGDGRVTRTAARRGGICGWVATASPGQVTHYPSSSTLVARYGQGAQWRVAQYRAVIGAEEARLAVLDRAGEPRVRRRHDLVGQAEEQVVELVAPGDSVHARDMRDQPWRGDGARGKARAQRADRLVTLLPEGVQVAAHDRRRRDAQRLDEGAGLIRAAVAGKSAGDAGPDAAPGVQRVGLRGAERIEVHADD